MCLSKDVVVAAHSEWRTIPAGTEVEFAGHLQRGKDKAWLRIVGEDFVFYCEVKKFVVSNPLALLATQADEVLD